MADSPNKHRLDPTRRRVLAAGGAGVAAAGLGAAYLTTTASAGEASKAPNASKAPKPAASASGEACLALTQETTEGPYYLDYDKYRSDITEGKEGIPLTLRVKVVESENCRPLRRVAVDIWQCDALGVYSSYEAASAGGGSAPSGAPSGTPTGTPTAAPSGGAGGGGHQEPDSTTTFLRGFQLTDRDGYVTFKTVFPGWYRGRAVHIHAKVHVDGTFKDGAYDGGHTCHTGQLFFPETTVEAVATADPYSTNTTERTTNATDNIYTGDTTQDGMLKLTYDKKNVAKGVRGEITIAVDADSVNTGEDTATLPSASATS